jgi:hypothetical protein
MANDPQSSQDLVGQMPALAEEFVQVCKTASIALDYQPRTLPLVDKFLNLTRDEVVKLAATKDPQAQAIWMKNSLWMAAYLGEVIRRETGGAWFESDKQLLIDIGTANNAVPLGVVQALFERTPIEAGGVKIESLKAYCEFIVRQQRQWLDRALLGTYASMTELRTSMTPDARLAGLLVGLAQAAVQTGKLRWNQELDFTADSLDGLESILATLHNLNAKAEPGQGATEEQIAGVAKLWGVYLGEVVRRRYGGQWALGADGVLALNIGTAAIFPVGKARKRIVDGPGDNVKFYFNSMAKVLG